MKKSQAVTVNPTRIIAIVCIAFIIAGLVLTRRSTVPDLHGARASEIETPGRGDYDRTGHDPGFFSRAVQVMVPPHISEGQTIALTYIDDGTDHHESFTVVRISAKKSLCRLYDRENTGNGQAPGKLIRIEGCTVRR
jgi:hypothetical protein